MEENGYKRCRIRAGLTAQEVAEKLDCAISSVFNWESGRNSPSAVTIAKLAELYHCSADELIGNETNK